MLTVLLPFLKKFAPYIIVAGTFFSVGSYAGYRFEVGALDAAKLALAVQQKNDVAAVAAANAIAASELAQAGAKANLAEAQLAAADAAAAAQETPLTSEIATEAMQPGQDAPDAPVLSTTLDELAKGTP